MRSIRILIADDSSFIRRIISDIVCSQSDMEVVGFAKDGEEAVAKALALRPDVITMDMDMPKKNGLESMRDILSNYSCKIIMVSSLTYSGSEITIDALNNGAYDFIQKPTATKSSYIETMGSQLIDIIRSGFESNYCSDEEVSEALDSSSCKNSYLPSEQQPQCLMLGASTGGPGTLFNIITSLPSGIRVPIYVVQHMPPLFTKAFADRLNKFSSLKVCEASDGQKPVGGRVYVAPGGFHMIIESDIIRLDESPAIHGVRPAVDKLFISASSNYKAPLVACILTGMGKDGAEGIRAVKQWGGYVLAQDQASSTVFGMPKAAIETGCVDRVLNPTQIAEELSLIFSTKK